MHKYAGLFALLCMNANATTENLLAEDIRFESNGVSLAATIFLPQRGEALCGISIIQGAGKSGRDNLWARQFAEQLAERGCAVLLPDKRGVGESEGDWRTAGFEELAADAVASLGALRAHPRVQNSKVGLLGLSQGGHIAPLAATKTNGAAFVIDAVGSLVPMEEQLYHELENAYKEHGLDAETIAYLQEFARASFDYLRGEEGAWERYIELHREIGAGPLAGAVESWPDTRDDAYWTFWGKIFDFDPLPFWHELAVERDIPCLVLFGERDEYENVPVQASQARAARLLEDVDFSLRVYPESGHGLFEPGTHRLRADMLEDVSNWIAEATRGSHHR